jgi:uncharacterized protein (TIGR03067 family)
LTVNRNALLTIALGLFVVASASAFAPKPADEKLTGDLAKLQGKWSAKIGPNEGLNASITFKGNAVAIKIVTVEGESFELNGEIKLDEKAKPHKAIDWSKFKTPMGDELPVNLGIYIFENDDAVKICNGGGGNDRPKEFKAEEGGPQLITMKRVVEKEKDKDKAKEKEKKVPKPEAGVQGDTAK